MCWGTELERRKPMNTSGNKKNTDENWKVDHDKTKCALCVVCAKNCPTNALRRDEEGGNLTLYFNAELCDGCGGNPLCEQNCPESAIVSVKSGSPTQEDGFVMLSTSPMAQCAYCDEYFAPIRRLDVVQQKSDQSKEVERVYCPLCRRQNLVVSYIEEKMLPGSHAEYRSARYMLKKAKKRFAEEQKNK